MPESGTTPAPRDRIAATRYREPWFLSNDNDSEIWCITDGVETFPLAEASQTEFGLAVKGTIERAVAAAFPVLAAEPTTAVTEEQHNIMASRGYDPNRPGEYERFIADGETFEWREQAGSDRTDPRFEVWEQEFFRHQPVLSMKHGGIVGCQCMDRVFVSKSEDWGTHLADVAWRLAALAPEPAETRCECFMTPESSWTTHYGAVEPGSQMEFNPECPVHAAVSPDEPKPAGVATHNTVSREQIAKAMFDADYESWNDGTTWQKLSERQKDEYRKLADAVLALLVPTSKDTSE